MDAFSPTQIRLDEHRCDAFRGDQALGLTRREYELMAAIVAQPNVVVSSSELLRILWEPSAIGGDHPIHVYMSRLRAKLAQHGGSSPLIRTVRGRGYMYSPPESERQVVTLMYDQHLILRRVEPDDRPFLGWDPVRVTDTFFLLTTTQRVHASRRVALALARVLAATGLDYHYGPQELRCADGSTRTLVTEMQLLTQRRRLVGLRATIHL